MDFKELLKYQLVSQMGIGAAATVRNSTTGATPFLYQALGMMALSLIDDMVKGIPQLFTEIKTRLTGSLKARALSHVSCVVKPPTLVDTSITLATRHYVSIFEMSRQWNTEGDVSSSSNAETSEESAGMVDAILARIAKLDNVPQFSLIDRGQVIANFTKKPIQMTPDIFVSIKSVKMAEGGCVQGIDIQLLSNTLSAAELANYVRNVYSDYLQEMKNALGNNIYFFDQKSKESSVPSMPGGNQTPDAVENHKRMRINTAPKQLAFTMSPFYSNKQFSNIYGPEIREIEKRLMFFLDRKDWYDAKGIPYQLGFLLSGIPGAGKTSVIRAIANLTKRHIVNVNFANITTATQLKNLFYSDKIQVYADQSMNNLQSYHIPVNQRIYVIEELDGNGDIVKQRSVKSTLGAQSQVVNDELTLQEILTVLDGTMEIPGRIVIMTTNHPEMLDRALIRPGRIDVQVHFDFATRELISEMFEGYLDVPLPAHFIPRLPDRKLSPAEVGQVLFRHFDAVSKGAVNFDAIMSDFIETAQRKLIVSEADAVVPQEMPSDNKGSGEMLSVSKGLSVEMLKDTPGTLGNHVNPSIKKYEGLPPDILDTREHNNLPIEVVTRMFESILGVTLSADQKALLSQYKLTASNVECALLPRVHDKGRSAVDVDSAVGNLVLLSIDHNMTDFPKDVADSPLFNDTGLGMGCYNDAGSGYAPF